MWSCRCAREWTRRHALAQACSRSCGSCRAPIQHRGEPKPRPINAVPAHALCGGVHMWPCGGFNARGRAFTARNPSATAPGRRTALCVAMRSCGCAHKRAGRRAGTQTKWRKLPAPLDPSSRRATTSPDQRSAGSCLVWGCPHVALWCPRRSGKGPLPLETPAPSPPRGEQLYTWLCGSVGMPARGRAHGRACRRSGGNCRHPSIQVGGEPRPRPINVMLAHALCGGVHMWPCGARDARGRGLCRLKPRRHRRREANSFIRGYAAVWACPHTDRPTDGHADEAAEIAGTPRSKLAASHGLARST